MESLEERSRCSWKSFCYPFGIRRQSLWNLFGISLESARVFRMLSFWTLSFWNLPEQEREARYICESFKAFTGVRVLLGAFSVLLAPFWTLLGTFFDALGCLLGALGRLFGASWVLLGRLLGPLDTILQFQSEFCSIWARQRLPKGSQEGAKIHPKSTPNRSKIEFKI